MVLARPRRPVWLSELVLAARDEHGSRTEASDDVLAALAVMCDHHEIHAVVRGPDGWVPAPPHTPSFLSQVGRALQSLDRDPVPGEVCVVLATATATATRWRELSGTRHAWVEV
jgi:hypothetical protein